MYKIVKKEFFTPNIFSMFVEAPRIAKSAKPGQFVIVITNDLGERVPLTICDFDEEAGTIEIVVQIVGASSEHMSQMEEGDCFKSVVGPLGQPSEFIQEDIEELKKKKILFVAGGLGTAPVYPQAKWLHDRGVKVDVILGAKTKDLVILEDKFRTVSENLYICTDDGSYGFKGMVTDQLVDLVENQGKEYDLCISIGPMIMMKFVCLTTKKYEIPTIVSINSIMVDGTGMCGACRVTVDGETKFACVDGPEFDGHLVDFDEALRRQTQYKVEEAEKEKAFAECEFWGGSQDG